MADYDTDRRERRKRRSRSYSSEPHDSKTRRADDPRRTKEPGRERDRPNHHDDKYPRRRSYSPEPPDRKRRRSYSQDRDSTKRRRSPRDDYSPRSQRSGRRHASRSRSRSRSRSHSPPRDRKAPPSPRRRTKRSPPPPSRRPARGPLPPQAALFNSSTPPTNLSKGSPAPPQKESPNFLPTGKLAAETNTVTIAGTAVLLKYHEPPDARLPPPAHPWRLYVFKGPDLLATLELGARSCWLFGRERSVVDVGAEHPSCSAQHAVVQFRWRGGRVRPYVMDLESANGTRVNGEGVPGGRFVELRSGDVLGFGGSEREYVLLLPPGG